jgi:NADH-quinone oxidoreductase subunit N
MALIGLLLVFAGLAFKIAAFPFHAYAADVYEGAASTVTGLLGFAPKFAGFLALIKIFAAFNWELPASFLWMVWIVAAATMTAGNVLALLQKNAKRMLAYSSIAHTGYKLIGLLVGPIAGQGPMKDGVAALLFYVAVYSTMNLGAFAVLAAFRHGDREMETLDEIGGLGRSAPLAALALATCVFSLVGVPPTAGFMGKLYLFSSAFSLGSHPFQQPLAILAVLAVINSAIGAAYYLRIIGAAYMGVGTSPAAPVGGIPIRIGAAVCSAAVIALFAWPMGLFAQSHAATTVLHRTNRPLINRVTSDLDHVPESPIGAPILTSVEAVPSSP